MATENVCQILPQPGLAPTVAVDAKRPKRMGWEIKCGALQYLVLSLLSFLPF